MTKVNRNINMDGNNIIFVEECRKYEKRNFKYYVTIDPEAY